MKKEVKLDLSGGIKRLKVLTNKIINTKFIGSYKSVFKGRGLEFIDYRPYTGDDDASMIDWKASVKSKKLLVKRFEEERDLNIFFLIDISSSMVCGTTDKLKIEYVGELAATLSFSILGAGDSVGFGFFNDKVIKAINPTHGLRQYNNFVRALVDPDMYGGKYDLGEALNFTLSFLKNASIVIILSDFIGFKKEWEKYVKMASKKFDLIGIMIRDPGDINLPEFSGQAIFEDPDTGRQILVRPEFIQQEYKKYADQQKNEIRKMFLNSNANFVELITDTSFVKPITDLFLRRSKLHR